MLQVWKQKGEEYRITGTEGWKWLSVSRTYRYVPQNTVGLRACAIKLKARRKKEIAKNKKEADLKAEKMVVQESKSETEKDNKMETEQEGDTKKEQGSEVKKEESEVKKEENEVKREESELEREENEVKREESAVENKENVVKREESEVENKESEVKREESEVENKESGIEKGESGVKKEERVVKMNDDREGEGETNKVVSADGDGKAVDTPGDAENKEQKMETDGEKKEEKMEIDSEKKEKKMEIDGEKKEEKMEIDSEKKESVIEKKEEKMKVDAKKDVKDLKKCVEDEIHLGSTENESVDLIDVTDALLHRTYYPKVTKPYSRLDQLLERRQRQNELEQKQKAAIQLVITKYKVQPVKKTKQKDKGDEEIDVVGNINKSLTNGDINDEEDALDGKDKDEKMDVDINEGKTVCEMNKDGAQYSCYSTVCRCGAGKAKDCYSLTCHAQADKSEPNLHHSSSSLANSLGKLNSIANETDCVENHDASSVNGASQCGSSGASDKSKSVSPTNQHSATTANGALDTDSTDVSKASMSNTTGSATTGHVGKDTETSTTDNKVITTSTKKVGSIQAVKSATSSGQAAKNTTTLPPLVNTVVGQTIAPLIQGGKIQLTPATVTALESKLATIGNTKNKVTLFKTTARGGRGAKGKGKPKSNLPCCLKFTTRSCIRNLFLLDKIDLKQAARRQGKREVTGFKYDCKMNNVSWPYPCPRPQFRTAWRYRTQTLKTIAAAALQLRILWAAIRWDDLSLKPPAGGTNTVTTETDITTTELVKRRDVGPYGLRSEFLVRKILVPIGVTGEKKSEYYCYQCMY